MRIIGISDIHGTLPKLGECDAVCLGVTLLPQASSLCNFGSDMLMNASPRYLLCGHIHGGNHESVVFAEDKVGKVCEMHNFSLKNEYYKLRYPPQNIVVTK